MSPMAPLFIPKTIMMASPRVGARSSMQGVGEPRNWRQIKPVGCVELAMTHRSASRCVFATHPCCGRGLLSPRLGLGMGKRKGRLGTSWG